MGSSSSSLVSSPSLDLGLRVLTLIFLTLSLILLVTDTIDGVDFFGFSTKTKFSDFYAYRYMLSATVIGMAYTLLQTAFTTFLVCCGNPHAAHRSFTLLINFYCDKVNSYLLGTGAAAGFGLTVDLNRVGINSDSAKDFLNKANIAAALLLFAFFFSVVSSVFSSYNLRRR